MRGTEGAPDFDDRFTDAEDFNVNFAFNFFIRFQYISITFRWPFAAS